MYIWILFDLKLLKSGENKGEGGEKNDAKADERKYLNNKSENHRLNMKLDFQSLFRLLCEAVLMADTSQLPPPPPSTFLRVRRRIKLKIKKKRSHYKELKVCEDRYPQKVRKNNH
jgi:hypothetical protein